MESFNGMVREIFAVTGDIGIEVLPFVPVVFDGIDELEMELIGGVQEWIKRISEKSGRDEIASLSETGGKESEMTEDVRPVFWKPSFCDSAWEKAWTECDCSKRECPLGSE